MKNNVEFNAFYLKFTSFHAKVNISVVVYFLRSIVV